MNALCVAFLSLFAAMAEPALAAEVSANPPAAQTETITPNRAFELVNALAQITGLHDEVVGQGANQRVSSVPYDLSPDPLWALTDDINILNAFIKDVQVVVKAMRSKAEADNGGPWPGECELPSNNPAALPPSDPKCAAQRSFVQKVTEFDDKERPINKLFRITRKDLKVGAPNRIPGPILSAVICRPDGSACIVEP
jgi:hypothetical protein